MDLSTNESNQISKPKFHTNLSFKHYFRSTVETVQLDYLIEPAVKYWFFSLFSFQIAIST